MKYIKRIIITFMILCIVLISGIFYTGYSRYRMTLQEKPIVQTVEEIRSNSNYITLKEINPFFLAALLAVEDPTFYEHDGIVLKNIAEAFFTNMKEHDLVMGGSTITQQLCKNLFLDQRKEFHRKAAELFFVRDLEELYTKTEILELYVNSIYFGDGYYGIVDASRGYFNVEPYELSEAQATLLAGLPQAPAVYQLSDGFDLAKKRQMIVLLNMEEQGLIKKNKVNEIYVSDVYTS